MTVMLWVVAGMVALNVLMILLTLGLKTARTVRRRDLETRAVRFEAALNDLILTGQTDPVLLRPNRRDLDLLATKMVEYLALLRGEQRDRLVELAERAGLVRKFFWRLGSQNRWRKAQAAESLGYFGGSEAAGPVAGLLTYDDETVRAVAARALARIGTSEAARSLAETLNDSSELTRLRMAENLERLGAVATVPLVETLKTGNLRARVLAARVLGNLRIAEAAPALREVLAPTDEEVQTDLEAQVVLALGRIGDPDDVPLILAASESGHWPVRAQAANALEAIGDTSAIGTLKRLTVDPEWWVRLNASRALSNMGPAGERALVEVLEGEDQFARDRAATSLEARGITRRAASSLAESGERGENARRLIRAMARAGSVRYLTRLAKTMPDDDDRRLLVEILESGGEAPYPQGPAAHLGPEEVRAAAAPPAREDGPAGELVPLKAAAVPARGSSPPSLQRLFGGRPVVRAVAVTVVAVGVAAGLAVGVAFGVRALGRVLHQGSEADGRRHPGKFLRGWHS